MPDIDRPLQNLTAGVHIRQSRRAAFHDLVSPLPAVIWVRSGTKRLVAGSEVCEVAADCFFILPDGRPMTVENIPPAGRAPYQAEILAFDRSIFEAAYDRMGLPADARRSLFHAVPPTGELIAAFLHARSAYETPEAIPDAVSRLRCEELVLWLAHAGAALAADDAPSLSQTLRRAIAADPARDWRTEDACALLAMSEATLRRRLRSEGTTFVELLIDVRMTVAVARLQTTNWKIGRIAASVGYDPPSRFTHRFRERFDLAPTDIRRAPRIDPD
ncbi:MAG: helix-turn-helix transcriptional regulator [Hyphomicrobiales bacterium]